MSFAWKSNSNGDAVPSVAATDLARAAAAHIPKESMTESIKIRMIRIAKLFCFIGVYGWDHKHPRYAEAVNAIHAEYEAASPAERELIRGAFTKTSDELLGTVVIKGEDAAPSKPLNEIVTDQGAVIPSKKGK